MGRCRLSILDINLPYGIINLKLDNLALKGLVDKKALKRVNGWCKLAGGIIESVHELFLFLSESFI